MVDEFYLPSPDRIAFQSKDNKQGSSPETVPDELKSNVLKLLLEEQKLVYTGYEQMLEDNIAKELSRINLPLSLYTEFYWKIDLHNLFKMMKLRIDDHAQYEIRVYANRIMDIVSKVAPIATEAFIEHVLYAKTFSRKEMEVLRVMSNQSDMNTDHINEMLGEKKAKEFLFKIRGF
jgi:thymidylate synthase (FAD)